MPDPKVPGEADSSQETESVEILAAREEGEDQQAGTGDQKPGAAPGTDESSEGDSSTSDSTEDAEEKTWFTIEILDAAGAKLSEAEKCKLTMPDTTEKDANASNGVHDEQDIPVADGDGTPSVKLADRYDYEWAFVETKDKPPSN